MDNNSFTFKIKVETNPLDISDLYEAFDDYMIQKKKHENFIASTVPKIDMLAETKHEMIMKQCQPLINIANDFNGPNSNYIYEIYARTKIGPNEYVMMLHKSRQGWVLQGTPYPECSIQTFSLKNIKDNRSYYLGHDNPFTKWNEWNIFNKLKNDLINQIKMRTRGIMDNDTNIICEYNRLIND